MSLNASTVNKLFIGCYSMILEAIVIYQTGNTLVRQNGKKRIG